mgnify:CR=1 FL=1
MVNLDKMMLEGAPNFARDPSFDWTADIGRSVEAYYKTPSYWE